MHGDFTRDTFDPAYGFSRVLLQQGRAELDADSNEQVAIFWHYLRALAADLVGPYGGIGDGFLIGEPSAEGGPWFSIASGVYYVDGFRCENRPDVGMDRVSYDRQPDYWQSRRDDGEPPGGSYLVYLDVWERFVTHVQTNHPIREVALNGADTGARARLVWQVRFLTQEQIEELFDLGAPEDLHDNWGVFVDRLLQRNERGQLRAQARRPQDHGDPCIISPEARYRGLENQLYRVEIYNGGQRPTFTWDRDNGSHVYPIRNASGMQVTLEHLGRDERERLRAGDLVEYVDDYLTLNGVRGPLFWVDAVDTIEQKVTLSKHDDINGEIPTYSKDDKTHPLLRRWQGCARVAAAEPEATERWLALEDGVEVQFLQRPEADGPPIEYRTGDFWLIPARVATGDVEWPGPVGDPDWRGPQGIQHHYAPLAYWNGNNLMDLRYTFTPLAQP